MNKLDELDDNAKERKKKKERQSCQSSTLPAPLISPTHTKTTRRGLSPARCVDGEDEGLNNTQKSENEMQRKSLMSRGIDHVSPSLVGTSISKQQLTLESKQQLTLESARG